MPIPSFRPLMTLLLASSLALGIGAPACATVAPLWYSTTVDTTASTATFSVQFDGPLDLFTTDAFARQADGFQFWVDSQAPDAVGRTYDALFGTIPATTQTVISAREIPTLSALETIWVLPLTAPGPRDVGGWGSIESHSAYSLSPGNLLTFSMPWSSIRDVDGRFYYAFETFAFGAGGLTTWEGVSGKYYEVCPVPEPSVLVLLLAGIGVLCLSGRRATIQNRVTA